MTEQAYEVELWATPVGHPFHGNQFKKVAGGGIPLPGKHHGHIKAPKYGPKDRFPIKDAADLQAAIKQLGEIGKQKGFKDKAGVESWIVERAKALGMEKLLPSSLTQSESKREKKVADKKLAASAEDGLELRVQTLELAVISLANIELMQSFDRPNDPRPEPRPR